MLKDLVPELTEILKEHPDFRFDNYDLKEHSCNNKKLTL